MEVVYRLPVKPQTKIPIEDGTPPIRINGAQVCWEVDDDSTLAAIELRISQQPLKVDERGVILSSYPELQALAYQLSSYIANSLYKQTGFDAIDPETVVPNSPELRAETADEEQMLASRTRMAGGSRRLLYSVRGNFEPDEYPLLYEHAQAVAFFADALRATSPFQQYELFYKVIEYFFKNKQGTELDKAVDAYVYPIDNRFNKSQMQALRELRIRSMHPHPRKSIGQHVNPEDWRQSLT